MTLHGVTEKLFGVTMSLFGVTVSFLGVTKVTEYYITILNSLLSATKLRFAFCNLHIVYKLFCSLN